MNPFTGENVYVYLDPGVTHSEREQVFAALRKLDASGPDEDGYYYVRFSGRGYIGFSAGDLAADTSGRGMAAEIVGEITQEAVGVLYKIAQAGNMSIGSSVDPNLVALVSSSDDPQVKRRWPDAPFLRSCAELTEWLRKSMTKGPHG